ncbi:BTAD domain-containing putative transcriptional regulator [Dactylosporangium sp. NPDC000521]|uniref:AfsR/SARP family transcriptional regulator n=1 Tax=Dactylosporangium sp. NPDC000521 TaxID=3363975 RepID=UPI0036C6A52B
MLWRILGSLETHGASGPVVLRARKQRLLLGVLLLHPNTPLPMSLLIECLWDGGAPRSARANLHSYVAQLRRTPTMGDRLASTPDGYLLRVEPDELDTEVFERLVAEGQRVSAVDGAEVAIERLGQALALWRGDVLAGIELPAPLRPLVTRLHELRLTTTEDWIDALLRADYHADVVAELMRNTEVHPLRERFQAQLMLALHRSGRTSEALATFRRFRLRLVDELGVEPAPALQRLHRRILAADPTLQGHRAPPPPEAGFVSQPRPEFPPTAGVVPRTLPPDVPNMVGRDDLLRELDGLLPDAADASGPGPLVVLVGIAGAGKTALAVRWAHRVAARFPDGQLHVNLLGWSAGSPLTPLAALTRCLRALGVPAVQIPVDVDDAMARYRTFLADRSLLLVLDNASSAEQVRPLLAAGERCMTVVTSRDQLTGLVAVNHARRLTVPPLTHDAAVTLLRGVLGRRLAGADAVALADLAEACGRLPLALRIAAAKCAERPDDELAAYISAFTAHGRLGELDVDDDPQASVRAAFAMSYRQLSHPHRVLFRRLGLVPGDDLTAETAAALIGPDADAGDATAALDALTAAHMVQRHHGRYSLHDLLRAYACDEARRSDVRPNGRL